MKIEPRGEEEALLLRFAAGERTFAGMDLDDRTYDFSNACLAGADFSHCFIVASFANAILTGVRFDGANVKTCDFQNANLSGASFAGAAIDGANFQGATLEGTSFVGASEQGHVYGETELPVFGAKPLHRADDPWQALPCQGPSAHLGLRKFR